MSRVMAVAAAALARAGVLRPLDPRKGLAILRAWRRWGPTPATLAAVAAIRWPDRTAVIDDDGHLTYAQLDQRANSLAAALAPRKPRAIGVMCRNHRGLLEGVLAAARLGADIVLVNTELPAAQLTPTLTGHDLDLLLHDDEFTDRLTEAALPATTIPLRSTRTPAPPVGKPDRVGRLVLLTSGTTGIPRGVPRAADATAMIGPAATVIRRLGLRTNQTLMVCTPAFHGMGLAAVALGLLLGDTIVLRRHPDTDTVLRDLRTHRVDVIVAVPTTIARLSRATGLAEAATGLRAVLSGGSPLNPAVADAFTRVAGPVLYNGYGTSEVGVATLATPQDLAQAPGTVGEPVLGYSARVLGPDGHPVPPGTVGDVHIGGGMVFDGYTGGGAKPVIAGHTSTGDRGRLDSRGRLHIDGRSDDMIVSGGENVYPGPVEEALLRHPAVTDCAVIGVPDPDFGHRLRAYAVTDTATPADLIDHLRASLTRYELPREIVLVDAIPRNATGKIVKHRLLE